MATFGAASDAVGAAVALQGAVAVASPDLAVRVGIASGDVAWEDGDCFGLPVVTAARLQAEAEGGQILVSDIVRLLAGDRAGDRFEPAGSLALERTARTGRRLPRRVGAPGHRRRHLAAAPPTAATRARPRPRRTGSSGETSPSRRCARCGRTLAVRIGALCCSWPAKRALARPGWPPSWPPPCTRPAAASSTAGATPTSPCPTNHGCRRSTSCWPPSRWRASTTRSPANSGPSPRCWPTAIDCIPASRGSPTPTPSATEPSGPSPPG